MTPIPRWLYATTLLLSGAVLAADDPSPAVQYPRPMQFRQNTPENLAAAGYRLGMVISDHFVQKRKYSDEAFKIKYPNKPVLIHVGGEFISANAYTTEQMMEDRGLVDTPLKDEYIADHGGFKEILSPDFVPMSDFLGYWIYEPGQNATRPIPATQVVEVTVDDPAKFAPIPAMPPATAAMLKRTTGETHTKRVVLLCPRGADGKLDWVHGELGEAVSVNVAAKTVSVRRFKTSRGWPELPAGTYLASNSARYARDDLWGMKHTAVGHPYHDPLWPWMMPNLTPFCPVDPRTGLNAAQWLAKHFIERKKKYYPHVDGFTLDVTTDTFIPGTRFINNADVAGRGVADMGQIDGVNYWALGMYDFVYYMIHGVPGKFDGLGKDIAFSWDSDNTGEQRYFDVMNGAEYEFGIIRDNGQFSSSLDRLLLWFEHGRAPNLTYLSTKLPNPIWHNGSLAGLPDEAGYRIGDVRLNLACAQLGTGYVEDESTRGPKEEIGYPGIEAEKKQNGGEPLPTDFDEYHEGKAKIYGWMGVPVGPAQRYFGQLSAPLYRFAAATPLPAIKAKGPKWAATTERLGDRGIRFNVAKTAPFFEGTHKFRLIAEVPIPGVQFEAGAEYELRFHAQGSSEFGQINERYRGIPRGISFRLRVNQAITGPALAKSERAAGNIQDILLFEKDRPVDVTLRSPTAGAGVLEICLSEAPGTIDITDLEIRKGSGDLMYRKFEHGLVVLNGSETTPVDVPLADLLPGESYRRLDGTQDAEHNNGQPVGKVLAVPAHDAYFLVKEAVTPKSS